MSDKNYMELAGETFEPYDPNKPLFTWKPDWSRTKEYLKSIIPGANAVDFYANNPDAPISETLSLLAEDFVPFYGNIKNDGDASDFITEAALMSLPMAKRAKATNPKHKMYKTVWGETFEEMPDGTVQALSRDYSYPDKSKIGWYDELTDADKAEMLKAAEMSEKAHSIVPKRSEKAFIDTFDYNGQNYTPIEFELEYRKKTNRLNELNNKKKPTKKDIAEMSSLTRDIKKMEILDVVSEYEKPTIGRNGADWWDANKYVEDEMSKMYGPYLEDLLDLDR